MRFNVKAAAIASVVSLVVASPLAFAQEKTNTSKNGNGATASTTASSATSDTSTAATTTTSYSKDQAVAKDTFKDEACPKPPTLMTGWYLGGQVGYDSYRFRQNINTPSTSSLFGTPAFNASGWVGGLLLGYGAYLSDWFYMAGEIFGAFSGASTDMSIFDGTVTYNNKIEAGGTFGLAALPGVKLTDASIGYLRLGWNWANLKSSESITGGASVSKTNTSNGFVLGVGMESLISGNWSVRTEFSHTFYSAFRTAFNSRFDPSDSEFMLAAIYHFD